MDAIQIPVPAFKTETLPVVTEKMVSDEEVAFGAGFTVGDGVLEGAGLVADVPGVTPDGLAGAVEAVDITGVGVVVDGFVLDAQPEKPDRINKDSTNVITMMLDFSLFNFILRIIAQPSGRELALFLF
jgi:hypothetical protein